MAPADGFLGENSIVGAGLPTGLGVSLARKYGRDPSVALVAVGDGALNQGVVHETLNMAAVLQVPLLLVVENNGYAEMTPADALTAVPAHVRVAAYGAPGVEVDGNDATAVEAAVRDARERCLAIPGPFIVEALTHRLVGHYSGDIQAYRPPGELEAARKLEPLARLANELAGDEQLKAVEEEVRLEIKEALDAARARPFPDPTTATAALYA